jgi:hypothetical protein
MTERAEKRTNPRLNLRYPIQIARAERAGATVLGRTVTQNLGARGAYFSTFETAPFSIDQEVTVTLTVPHRLAAGGHEVMLDMRGRGRIVRVEGPEVHRRYGEDGASPVGVAVEFAGPLSFHYRWV